MQSRENTSAIESETPPSGGRAEDDNWTMGGRRPMPVWLTHVRHSAHEAGAMMGRYLAQVTPALRDLLAFAARLARASFKSFGRLCAGFGDRAQREWSRARNTPLPRLPGVETARDPKASPLRRIAILGGYAAGAVVAMGLGFVAYVWWGMPSTDDLWAASQNPSLEFRDRYGRTISREGAQNGPPVTLSDLPDYVPEAVIAIEDKRFYNHIGVDVNGLSRAILENVRAGRVVQGGSTLTQQLAKNLFLTNERTFRRKAQEVVMALRLEAAFNKDEIMALYLSRVYFGAGAWGIEAASERYFDKPAKELTLQEAALLAGLLKAPSRMNPANQDTAAKARALVVLNEMVSDGFITPEQRDEAKTAKLPINRKNPSGNLGYFRDWIDPLLNEIIGDQRDDFIIETSIDLEAQRTGERALVAALEEQGKALNVTQGALLSLDSSGGVRAMIGGTGYSDTQFNRTTQARRQPGSSFKYFIYATALQEGISPYSVRMDQPIVIGDWAPGNYEDEYLGAVPLTTAFAQSLNTVAIQLANETGGRKVIDLARDLGVRTRVQDYRSLALGAQEMTLLELTQSYGAMINDGAPIKPHGILRIRRATGNVLWSRPATQQGRVLQERTVRGMNLLMSGAVQRGTGTRARIEGREIGGKTGTTNDYRDAWFIGFSGDVVTGVWVGNDNFVQTKKVTGGSLPARVWRDFMVVALKKSPQKRLALPQEGDFPPPVHILAGGDTGPMEGIAESQSGAPLLPIGGADAAVNDYDAAPSLDTPEG
jgi:penicillin-binding protein 1A